ncbi:LexA family protein [Snodgrassella communis]|uniref:Peptidase S24/S26A/S26B/S26C domain-containing protein n=1 Tax=Snodgrassella alvi TaxID=1196083 RepID=A0A2N9XPD4_9NEIS|nr:S24 family peptidase [Snodgrassella communis]PIT50189.1 hypothetical protein BHC48_07225 [Snodgrassella communis]
MIPIYETNQENQLIDLQQYLIRNQPATIAVRCGNESMRDAGISTGDILIIDRSIEAQNGNVVMADIGNAFTIRRLVLINGISWLNSDNSATSFDNYAFQPDKDMAIIGVVTFVIKAVR